MAERFTLRHERGWYVIAREVWDDDLQMWSRTNDVGKFPTRDDARLYMVGRSQSAAPNRERT